MTTEFKKLQRCMEEVNNCQTLPYSVVTKLIEVLNEKMSDIEGPKNLAEELKQSRDKEFGRQFGKLLKEYNVESKIRELAKQGYNRVAFDMKEGFDRKLFSDPRFAPAIKNKFGKEFIVNHDTSDIVALGYVVGRKDIYVISWT